MSSPETMQHLSPNELQHLAEGEKLEPKRQQHMEECEACQELFLQQVWRKGRATAPIAPQAALSDSMMQQLKYGLPTEESKPAPQPRTKMPRIDGYQMIKELGKGGMGVVYLARDVKLGRQVAIKVILVGQEAHSERFQREARTLAQLSHPNITTLHEYGETEDHPYLVQEYVPGGALSTYLDGRPIKPEEAALLVKILAEAVQAAHERRIVHRDLKPENVLMRVEEAARTGEAFEGAETSIGAKTATGARDSDKLSGELLEYRCCLRGRQFFPKIADFGLAKDLDSVENLTETNAVIGTPNYLAPELIPETGKPARVTPAVDVYSLGTLLYHLLTGGPPFRSHDPLLTLLQVRERDPIPPRHLQPEIPRDLETICLKSLEKNPEKRYDSALILAERLKQYLKGEPIPDRHYGAMDLFLRRCRRNPLVTTLVSGLILSLLVGMALILWQSGVARKEARLKGIEAEKNRNLTHQRTVDAARFALRRGDFIRAAGLYSKAIEESPEEALPLRVERLQTFLPLGQYSELKKELHELGSHPDIAAHRATLDLLRADLALTETGQEQEINTLLDSALSSGEISKANQAYARALKASSPLATLKHLNECLQQEPFHHRARTLKVLVFIFEGESKRAEAEALELQKDYPADTIGHFLEAMSLMLQGRTKEQNAKMKQLKEQFSERFTEQQMQNMQAVLADQGKIIQELNELEPYGKDNLMSKNDLWSRLQASLGISSLFSGLMKASQYTMMAQTWGKAPSLERFGLAIQNMPWIREKWEILPEVVTDYSKSNYEKAIERLSNLIEKQPHALLLYMRSTMSIMAMRKPMLRNDNEGMRRYLFQARDDCRRAMTAPTWIKSLHKTARIQAVLINDILLNAAIDPPAAMIEESRELHRPLLFQQRLTMHEHRIVTEYRAKTLTQLPPDMVLPFLREWETLEPESEKMLKHRATWELRDKSYSVALRYAQKILKKNPKDVAMLKVEKEAMAALKAQIQSK